MLPGEINSSDEMANHPALYINPCAGTLEQAGFICSWIRDLINGSTALQNNLNSTAMTDLHNAIQRAFKIKQSISKWHTRTDVDIISRQSGRWITDPTKWLLITADETSYGTPKGCPMCYLTNPTGLPYKSLQEALRNITEEDIKWIDAHGMLLLDGTLLQKNLGGAILILPEVADRIKNVLPPSLLAIAHCIPDARVINVKDQDDIERRLRGLKLVPLADGTSETQSILNQISGQVLVQEEVTISDIRDQLTGENPESRFLHHELGHYTGSGALAYAWDWRGTDLNHLIKSTPGEMVKVNMVSLSALGQSMANAAIAAMLNRIRTDIKADLRAGKRSPLILVLDGCLISDNNSLVSQIIISMLNDAKMLDITLVFINILPTDISRIFATAYIGQVIVAPGVAGIKSLRRQSDELPRFIGQLLPNDEQISCWPKSSIMSICPNDLEPVKIFLDSSSLEPLHPITTYIVR